VARLVRPGGVIMLAGSCLCGAVRISVRGALEHQPEACHCVQCRKQSGSFMMGVNVRRTRLEIDGEESVGWYASSEQVDRGFCVRCGSSLFWRPKLPGYEWISVAMGLFDEPIDAHLSRHTFVGEKGTYYELGDGVPQSDGY
jgi:hypothetical protein